MSGSDRRLPPTGQEPSMAVPHDDLLRDNSGAIIQRDREALMQADGGHELGQRALQSSGVKHRVDRRQ